ncbi:MAG: Cof-type HAD-IIB family hydrolase [Oscillospiraceae bacterium]|nr:Cof-type HAD-IIB family hydrolase [Oscillospiraceae bacterium]
MAKFDGSLLVSDMDGTLLDSAHEISRENTEAIKYFTDNGGLFTVASGRMVRAIALYADRININAPVISFNGAAVYDTAGKKLLKSMPHEADIPALVSGLAENFPELGIEVFTIDEMYICRGSDVTRLHCEIIRAPYALSDVRDIKGECMKLNLTQEPSYLERVERYLNERWPGMFCIVHTEAHYLELMRPGVNKGRGLSAVAEILNIARERVCAVGDYFNDAEMLEFAGIAVAPANACPQIKDIADVVVSSNDEHAVREAVIYLESIS